MSAHESHLARELNLLGRPKLEHANPYVSRMSGGEDIDYAALVLCKGRIVARAARTPAAGRDPLGRDQALHREFGPRDLPALQREGHVNTIDAIVDKLGG
jgi:hypothetical protein